MRARILLTAAFLGMTAFTLPVMAQSQSPWANGSFLNGTNPAPITNKPIALPKMPAPKLPGATKAPPSGFLGRIYPKISLGAWPSKSAKTPSLPTTVGPSK